MHAPEKDIPRISTMSQELGNSVIALFLLPIQNPGFGPTFADHIKKARKKQNLSDKDFARQLASQMIWM
jgi:DNA-binding transcriptional regulator YiaG